MYFGVDYHPEQWVYPYGGTAENPEAAWHRDAELMAQAGVNVARMGEFVWGICEPEAEKTDSTSRQPPGRGRLTLDLPSPFPTTASIGSSFSRGAASSTAQ